MCLARRQRQSASRFRDGLGSRALRGGEGRGGREGGSGSADSPPLVLKQQQRGARGVRKHRAVAAVLREGDSHGALKPPLTSSIAASRSPPSFSLLFLLFCFVFALPSFLFQLRFSPCAACDCWPCLVSPLLPFTCHTSPLLCVCVCMCVCMCVCVSTARIHPGAQIQ